ncbi:MAG: hypothetical protein H7258_02985 [Ferruginibacter sp.]|nr:hypothetical protein [Ferruginibacter sp.]
MDYTLNAITSVADCDTLLRIADIDQQELNYKKIQQDRAYGITSSGSSGVDAQLTATLSEITGLEAAVANLPEGPAKQNLVDRIADLQHKKYLLEKRRRRYGSLAMLQKQYAISCIEKQVVESVNYIDAVTRRKADLQAV